MVVKIRESKKSRRSRVTEDVRSYEIKNLSMDVAVRPGQTIGYKETSSESGTGSLYNDIAEVLARHGYEMAGDFIDVSDADTDVYVDNGYMFFDESARRSRRRVKESYSDGRVSIQELKKAYQEFGSLVKKLESSGVDSIRCTPSNYSIGIPYLQFDGGFVDLTDTSQYLDESLKEGYYDGTVSVREIESFMNSVEDFYDAMTTLGINKINASPNTYGLRAPYGAFNGGFVDFDDYEKYFSDDDGSYDEGNFEESLSEEVRDEYSKNLLSKITSGSPSRCPNVSGYCVNIDPSDEEISRIVDKLGSLGFTEVDRDIDDSYMNDSQIVFTKDGNGTRVLVGVVFNARDNFAQVSAVDDGGTGEFESPEDEEWFTESKKGTKGGSCQYKGFYIIDAGDRHLIKNSYGRVVKVVENPDSAKEEVDRMIDSGEVS